MQECAEESCTAGDTLLATIAATPLKLCDVVVSRRALNDLS
jgi:hypothetical protein